MRQSMPLRFSALALAFIVATALGGGPARAADSSPAVPAGGPHVGEPAPPFDLGTIDGKRTTLASLRGKTLVVNVWATWCPPCRQEMPDLIRAAPKLAKAGVALIGVDTTEDAPVVRAYAAAKAVDYPLAIDRDHGFASAYDIAYFPTTFVIDPQGILRARYIDVLAPKQLFAMVEAARQGRTVALPSPLQDKIDATLGAAPHDFSGDAAAVEAAARKAASAIDAAEKDLDDSDAAGGNPTDLPRTRAEEATLRDAAIAALVNVGPAVDDKTLLPRLRGDAALDREAWDEALTAYAAVLESEPNDPAALAGTAQAASRLQKYDVLVASRRALAALPGADSADIVALARAQASAGDRTGAAATFAQAVAAAQQAVDGARPAVKALRGLAYAYLYAGRFESIGGDPARAEADYGGALAAAERLPQRDARHDMYVEEAQEGSVALALGGHRAAALTLAPWTGADLPGSSAQTIKYRLVLAGKPGRTVALSTSDVPAKWVATFCSDRVCQPFRTSVVVPESGVKVVEFALVPPGGETVAPRVRVTAADGSERLSATT